MIIKELGEMPQDFFRMETTKIVRKLGNLRLCLSDIG